MAMRLNWSIVRIIRILTVLIILLVITNLFAVIVIGSINHSVEANDRQSSEYLQEINKYILLVRDSGLNISSEIINQYTVLQQFRSTLDKRLTAGNTLEYPAYSTEAEKSNYYETIKTEAQLIRQNLSAFIDTSYNKFSITLAICVTASVLILLFTFFARFADYRFKGELNKGLAHLNDVLAYKKDIPVYDEGSSHIKEIQNLKDSFSRMESDILYDRKLIDTGFHGNLDLFMMDLFSNIRSRMPCDRIALAFIDSAGMCTAETAITSYNNTFLQPGFRVPVSETSLPAVVKDKNVRKINDLRKYAKHKKGSVSNATNLILKEGLQSSLTAPMIFDDKCLGFFFVSSSEKNAYNNEMENYISRVINILKQKFYIEFILQQVIAETSNAFVDLMEEKDNETSSHILRMSQYSYIIARSYHDSIKPLLPRFMREILWFAPLHDIGKVGIPDAILLKEGPLSDEQMKIMKGHVDIGLRVLEKMNVKIMNIVSSPLMRTGVEIISGHHEKFDGTGYPEGRKGRDIPLAGRIVAVADVFDALTSRRPYKEAFSIEKAVDIIENDMKNSFDPEVLKAFKLGLNEIKKVYDELKEI